MEKTKPPTEEFYQIPQEIVAESLQTQLSKSACLIAAPIEKSGTCLPLSDPSSGFLDTSFSF